MSGYCAEAFKDTLERVKWTFMHGKPGRGVESAENPDDECHKLKQAETLDLYDYLSRNQAYLVNYQEQNSRTKLTRQVAESHRINDQRPTQKKWGKCNGLEST